MPRVGKLTAAFAAIVAAAAIEIAGCGTSSTHDTASSGIRPAAHHAKIAPPLGTLPKDTGTFKVGTVDLALTEPSAAASATGQSATGQPIRSLPIVIRYPAVGPANGTIGGFPLVVFSQGFDVSSASYAALLDAWASAGYVVAAPTYPYTDPGTPGGPNENDLVNHPADLRFVTDSLLSQPPAPLRGLIDRNEVAVVGQSDGGDVSLAVADNSCCADASVKAAVILSGAELASFGGTYYHSTTVPLLVVQGSADTINAPGCSAELYDQSPAPKYYVDLLGAGHLPPYLDSGPDQTVVERTTIDFFNGYLKHASSALARLPMDGSPAGSATISSSPSLPGMAANCPGAP